RGRGGRRQGADRRRRRRGGARRHHRELPPRFGEPPARGGPGRRRDAGAGLALRRPVRRREVPRQARPVPVVRDPAPRDGTDGGRLHRRHPETVEMTMVAQIIEYCAKNRTLVFLGVGFALLGAIVSIRRIPLDAIPDLSDPQVIIFTEWMGRSPTL